MADGSVLLGAQGNLSFAFESEQSRRPGATRQEGVCERRLRDVPHATSLHEQHAHPGYRFLAQGRSRDGAAAHYAFSSRHRSESGTEDKKRNRLLQSSFAERALVSEPDRALGFNCDARGVVRSARLKEDYVPSGWKAPGRKTRAVPGHEFGMDLSVEDKRALIAFLKTL